MSLMTGFASVVDVRSGTRDSQSNCPVEARCFHGRQTTALGVPAEARCFMARRAVESKRLPAGYVRYIGGYSTHRTESAPTHPPYQRIQSGAAETTALSRPCQAAVLLETSQHRHRAHYAPRHPHCGAGDSMHIVLQQQLQQSRIW